MTIATLIIFFVSLLTVLIVVCVQYDEKDKGKNKRLSRLWFVPMFFLIVFILVSVFAIVPAGHRGVLLRFGKVEATYREGLNTKIPLVDRVINMSVQTQLYEVPNATSASKDLQDVMTSVAINYKLDPGRVGEIYRTLGIDYIIRIAQPAVQEVVKATTAEYNAEDLILRRSDVKKEIEQRLSQRLLERGIITEIINITNFQFSPEFTKAIEAKVVAVQAVLEAENKLKRIEVEARQAEAKAKGDAAAMIARAEGQARAAEILVQMIKDNPAYLQYMYIDKLAANAQVIIVPEGMPMTIPFK